jgi:hypothetical protein
VTLAVFLASFEQETTQTIVVLQQAVVRTIAFVANQTDMSPEVLVTFVALFLMIYCYLRYLKLEAALTTMQNDSFGRLAAAAALDSLILVHSWSRSTKKIYSYLGCFLEKSRTMRSCPR